MPEVQGKKHASLRCTLTLRADRSRSCAEASPRIRGWHPEHPQSPWAPALPHTFKRRRKFENSQPPSSSSSSLPPRLTPDTPWLFPAAISSPLLLLLPPTRRRRSLEDRLIATRPFRRHHPSRDWPSTVSLSRRPSEASSQRAAEVGSEERESTARRRSTFSLNHRPRITKRRQTGGCTPTSPTLSRPRDHRCRRDSKAQTFDLGRTLLSVVAPRSQRVQEARHLGCIDTSLHTSTTSLTRHRHQTRCYGTYNT